MIRDANTPGTIESRVLDLLRKRKKEKNNKDAALLAVIGIGLLALISSRK